MVQRTFMRACQEAATWEKGLAKATVESLGPEAGCVYTDLTLISSGTCILHSNYISLE